MSIQCLFIGRANQLCRIKIGNILHSKTFVEQLKIDVQFTHNASLCNSSDSHAQNKTSMILEYVISNWLS